MSIGSFTIIKNEILWIGAHLQAWLPYLDEMVFFDGNSTDGTLEVLRAYQKDHPMGDKLTVVTDKDPKNLFKDYMRINNECLKTLSTTLAWFLHPDMFPIQGEDNLKNLGVNGELAYFIGLKTYGGNPQEKLYYENGRAKAWKTIMRLRNPDLGLHYFGAYGASNEDMYFREITGESHDFYDTSFDAYPYEVLDSNVLVAHFADVRPYKRRLEKMTNILITLGHSKEEAALLASKHPRVNFKSEDNPNGVKFIVSDYPSKYVEAAIKHTEFLAGVDNAFIHSNLLQEKSPS